MRRLEIRRLLSLNTEAARKEAIKLTWIYLQKKDIGDGHEYPMYLFLGGEPLWAVRAHKSWREPHEVAPDHAYISLAVLYIPNADRLAMMRSRCRRSVSSSSLRHPKECSPTSNWTP